MLVKKDIEVASPDVYQAIVQKLYLYCLPFTPLIVCPYLAYLINIWSKDYVRKGLFNPFVNPTFELIEQLDRSQLFNQNQLVNTVKASQDRTKTFTCIQLILLKIDIV